MQKIISILCALLAVFSVTPAYSEDAVQTPFCAEWKSAVAIDTKALDKLATNSAKDKPEKGALYTKKQFAALLGKDIAAAKEVLANSKDKLPKTSDGKVDLKDVTLEGFNLTGLNLDNVDLKGAEMNGANLSGSSLRGASLYKAELEGANLNHTDLSFANMSKATLLKASLCQAIMTSVDIEDAEILGAYLKGARLDMARNLPRTIYLNVESVLNYGLPVPMEK